MTTPGTEVWISKYHLSLKATRNPWIKIDFSDRAGKTQEDPRTSCIAKT